MKAVCVNSNPQSRSLVERKQVYCRKNYKLVFISALEEKMTVCHIQIAFAPTYYKNNGMSCGGSLQIKKNNKQDFIDIYVN